MKLSVAAVALLVASCLPALAQQSGAALYAQHCASCHDAGDQQSRVPNRSALQLMAFEHVLGIITSGSMADMTRGRTADERKAIASFVTGRSGSDPPPIVGNEAAAVCANRPLRFAGLLEGPRWNGWGADLNNSRFQPLEMARLTPDQVPRLQLKWAFGFPGVSSAIAQPTVIGGVLFVGGADRKLHALDAETGCTLWTFTTDAPVRTAVTFGPLSDTDQFAVYFGDVRANAYAVNATTGALVWKKKVEDHPAARVTGTPTLFSGLLYVPVSSIEEATGSRPTYECCTFRGSVVALDAATGRQIWKAYTIPEAPHPTSKNAAGIQLYGPSGASVWSSPTIDVQRDALYVATGNSYSNPAADTSDAIVAFDLKTGQMLWHRQATPKDSYVVACYGADKTNCPEDHGPDHDFGQSPILVSLHDGRRMLVIGQKSGVVHAFGPDEQGKPLWQTRVGKGGPLGGMEWGSAADQDRIYVANSDVRFLRDGTRRLDPTQGGGLFALNLSDGSVTMQVPPVSCGDREQCSPALSAAVTVIPGVVFAGGVSGYLRAYATDDARLLWEFNTARDHATVNGVSGHGGAIDGPGPVIVDGMLYVNSGYAQWSGVPGNVLLAFGIGDR
jgi:polyvinyl alcohol dehydrogenase (cytochrome)